MNSAEMDIDSARPSRKKALQEAVDQTLADVFSIPQLCNFFEAELDQHHNDSDTQAARKIVTHISEVMRQSVQVHVAKWITDRGLDQIFAAVDETSLKSSLTSEESLVSSLASPCSTYPGSSFAQIKLKCKQQQLEDLRKQLEAEQQRMENARTELAGMVEVASSLNSKLNRVDNSSGVEQFSSALLS